MKTFRAAMVCLVVLSFVLQATAKEWEHPGGFKFTLPDNWKVTVDKDVLVAKDPTGEVGLTFFVVEDVDSLKTAVDAVEKELGKTVDNLKFEEPKENTLNGLDMLSFDGTGTISGTPADLTISVFHKKKKFLVMFGAVNTKLSKKFEPTLVDILKSIQ